MLVLLLVLEKVLRERTSDSTTDRSENTVALFGTEVMTTEGTAESTKHASIRLGHWRSTRIVVGCVGICGLFLELMVGVGLR